MALYKPSFLLPYNTAIDATIDNDFTLQIEGTICVGYKITILRNSDSAIIYDPAIVDLTLTPLYNGDTLTITVPLSSGMVNGTDYKWKVDLYEVSPFSTPITSEETFFKARTTPVVAITNFVDPVVIRNYTFLGSYTQAENVPIKYYQFILYNASNNEILRDTGKIFSANIQFNYDLYLSGQSYEINLIVENQDGTIIETTNQAFDVTYVVPAALFPVVAENNPDNVSIDVNWSGLIQIPGDTSGIAPSYATDTPFVGTDSIQIPNGTELFYDEKNAGDLDLASINTIFIHTTFNSSAIANNIFSGSGWSISGVIAIQELIGDSGTIRKILTFENGTSFKLYTQLVDGNEPVLVNTYNVIGATSNWLLTASGVPSANVSYVWDDSQTWDDNLLWTESLLDTEDVWWLLAWRNPTETTHNLVWKRDENV